MEYIALILVLVALVVGVVCGIVQNILAHKKKENSKNKIVYGASEPVTCVTFVPAEKNMLAGNVSLIEERCDDKLNKMMDSVFGHYKRN